MTRKPDWLRVNYNSPERAQTEQLLETLGLNTVCAQAACPNIGECFSRKTATFMILGTQCTRSCGFCNVRHGQPEPIDPGEPERVAQAVVALGLRYVVVTTVTRDDLPDGGAAHFADVIRAIKQAAPQTAIEVLVPDFQGSLAALRIVTEARPEVISHNMETVAPLYAKVRPQAEYERSLWLLRQIKQLAPGIRAKSGFMLGLGESDAQVQVLLKDLRAVGCELLTIGQYLAPSKQHLPVQEYVEPARFEALGEQAHQMGFSFVMSAPLVRSSYNAEQALEKPLI